MLPSNAFGKLQRNEFDAVIGWHPLIDHMIDVAACFKCLCVCRSIRRFMRKAAGRLLDVRDIERLSVLVFLHDIGKANSGFQAKRWKNKQDIPKGWPCHAGHGVEALKLFDSFNQFECLLALLPFDQMGAWGDACYPLLVASISHHGRPLKDTPSDWNRSIWKQAGTVYDPAVVLYEMGKRVVELFPQAFEPGGRVLPDAPAFGHLFAGLVQLADWLGSDTRFFPYSKEGEDRSVTAKEKAYDAIAASGLNADDWRDKLKHNPPSFTNTFGIAEPRPIQTAINDERFDPLVILESETGSGKTEAALWRFVHLFRAGLVDSLYFALPTRVAASQIVKPRAILSRLGVETASNSFHPGV